MRSMYRGVERGLIVNLVTTELDTLGRARSEAQGDSDSGILSFR